MATAPKVASLVTTVCRDRRDGDPSPVPAAKYEVNRRFRDPERRWNGGRRYSFSDGSDVGVDQDAYIVSTGYVCGDGGNLKDGCGR